MNQGGFTTRDVGNALGLDHSAVARWLKGGTKPYRSSLAKLATFFEVPIETLIDDSIDLPPVASSPALEEAPLPNSAIFEPINTAAVLAQRRHGPDAAAGQATFEHHLANLRALRDQAERQHPRDPAAAAVQLDTLLAAYISALDAP